MTTAPTPIQYLATAFFALAILHTFATSAFARLATRHPRHAGLWHLLGEVEAVFGIWAMLLVVAMALLEGGSAAKLYMAERNFTEPMFVFAIMVVAATRPVLQTVGALVDWISVRLPVKPPLAFTWSVLTVVPVLGSFITEPAAMTLAAIMLSRRLLAGRQLPAPLLYGLLGVLFVNVSIGGTLTPFAAPPVLMVASTWNWDTAFMLGHFGWKAALACALSAALLVALFRAQLLQLGSVGATPQAGKVADMASATLPAPADAHEPEPRPASGSPPVPWSMCLLHLGFLAAIVSFAHEPPLFAGVFLLFLGVASAYPQHQDRLVLREALMVAFFLAGLVVLGGMQSWWLGPLLLGMSSEAVFWGATALTAITDNAALTYLGSQVQGLDPVFQYALVAGAVTGGGLTVIANAPNPAGMSILRGHFRDGTVSPLWLLVAALGPTLVAVAAFRLL